MHDQRRLHAHRRAVAAIHPLGFAGDESVNHVARCAAAVLLRQGRAQEAEFTQLRDDVAVELLVASRHQNARHKLLLTVGTRRIASHPFFIGQLALQQQRIVPLEGAVLVRRNGLDLLRQCHRIHRRPSEVLTRRLPGPARPACVSSPHPWRRRARPALWNTLPSSFSWFRGSAPAPKAGFARPEACSNAAPHRR
jgi:hypothetical protein